MTNLHHYNRGRQVFFGHWSATLNNTVPNQVPFFKMAHKISWDFTISVVPLSSLTNTDIMNDAHVFHTNTEHGLQSRARFICTNKTLFQLMKTWFHLPLPVILQPIHHSTIINHLSCKSKDLTAISHTTEVSATNYIFKLEADSLNYDVHWLTFKDLMCSLSWPPEHKHYCISESVHDPFYQYQLSLRLA